MKIFNALMFNWKNRMIMYIFEITRVLSWEMMDRIDIIHRMTQTSFILCFSYQSKTTETNHGID